MLAELEGLHFFLSNLYSKLEELTQLLALLSIIAAFACELACSFLIAEYVTIENRYVLSSAVAE